MSRELTQRAAFPESMIQPMLNGVNFGFLHIGIGGEISFRIKIFRQHWFRPPYILSVLELYGRNLLPRDDVRYLPPG